MPRAALLELVAEAQRQNIQAPEGWFPATITARKKRGTQTEPPRTYEEAVAQVDANPARQGVIH